MAAKADNALRTVLADNLRRFRANLGLSQEALADEAQLHRTFVGAVERRERNISLDNIEKLAMARAELADLERVAAARRYRGAVNGQVQAILAAALGWFAAQR